MAKDFGGLSDQRVMDAFDQLIELSGDRAFDQLHKLFSRIGKKRFDSFEHLLKTIRFFGGRLALVHRDDLCECEITRWGVTDPEVCPEDEKVSGFFRPVDLWIELALHQITSFKQLEEVLRHEVIHLLQHMTNPSDECPCCRTDDHLLSDVVAYGDYFARIFREHADDEFPSYENEAYAFMSWSKSVKSWSQEVMTKPELWSGRACLISPVE